MNGEPLASRSARLYALKRTAGEEASAITLGHALGILALMREPETHLKILTGPDGGYGL